ncbi:MAG: winged helix-turn-helix transcriptional regulator [Nanoarchaeota archaeon]|nr:winged helix-turn-helix transcriptional regulator [Nanoarchaeota archaeon]
MRITKITIFNRQTVPDNVNDLLLAFGHSLGLFSLRDKDKSCYRIFIVLVKALKVGVELTSDELALQTGLTRGTVIHHLNNLMATGIVTNYKNKYFISVDNLEQLVEEMRSSVNKLFDNIGGLAKRIDRDIGLK